MRHDSFLKAQGRPPAVYELTLIFFVLYLLMATQDIAVDGWALTMLQRRVSDACKLL